MEKAYLIEIIEQTIEQVNSIKNLENKVKAIDNAADRIILNQQPIKVGGSYGCHADAKDRCTSKECENCDHYY